jgi:hypothetical protein
MAVVIGWLLYSAGTGSGSPPAGGGGPAGSSWGRKSRSIPGTLYS